MDNTLLVSLSQQMAASRSMDIIANNLANASTPAYKRETMKFEELLANVRPSEGETGQQHVSFVQDKGAVRDLTNGQVDKTGDPFDLAINGSGYFVVQTPTGNQYTRNGHFTLDPGGQIVTQDGYPLQGDGGAITISSSDGDIHIAQDGTISGANGQIGKVQVVTFANERALQKQGSSLYSTTQAPTPATNMTVLQGSLEGSNVQPVVEISHMIEVMRAYQATASLTQSHEQLLLSAIDKLGAVAN